MNSLSKTNLNTKDLRRIILDVRDGIEGPHKLQNVLGKLFAEPHHHELREMMMQALQFTFEYGHVSGKRAIIEKRREAAELRRQQENLTTPC